MRLFTEILRAMAKGSINEELSDKMQELIQKVSETGKDGSITLKLTVKANGVQQPDQVYVASDIKVSMPQPARANALFYVTEDYRLSRRDPNQADIEEIAGPRPVPDTDAR